MFLDLIKYKNGQKSTINVSTIVYYFCSFFVKDEFRLSHMFPQVYKKGPIFEQSTNQYDFFTFDFT